MDWDYPDYNPHLAQLEHSQNDRLTRHNLQNPGRNSTDPKEKADYNQDNPNP